MRLSIRTMGGWRQARFRLPLLHLSALAQFVHPAARCVCVCGGSVPRFCRGDCSVTTREAEQPDDFGISQVEHVPPLTLNSGGVAGWGLLLFVGHQDETGFQDARSQTGGKQDPVLHRRLKDNRLQQLCPWITGSERLKRMCRVYLYPSSFCCFVQLIGRCFKQCPGDP